MRHMTLFILFKALLLVGVATVSADDIPAQIAAAGNAEDYDADAVIVFDHTDVHVRPNGIGTARHHQLTKILREPAIRTHAVQRFPFDPHTNRLELVEIRIHRADGSRVHVPVDDVPKQPQTAWGIFWPTDQFLVDLPRLAVGDAIETVTKMTGFNVAYLADQACAANGSAGTELNAYGNPLKPPVPGHWHDEVHFWTTNYPIIEKRYSVRMAKDKPLQFEVYNGELETAVLMDGDEMIYTFEKEDLAPLRGESRMESWPNVGTKLLLATLPTWEDKARWLYEVSEPQFEWDDAIAKKTHEIIEGLETDEEIYTALNHWVAENIRYAGTSRGMCEGYTVHRSIETFHDRCGVCKDKAGMLVTMLRVAGYDAYLVMTMARQRVDRVPADQFNHAVTCIRWDDGSLTLLDPTWMVKNRDNWSTLEPLQHVVYGLPQGGGLAKSPYFPPETCRATWHATSNVSVNRRLGGEVAFDACGAPEGRLRRALAGYHPAERQDFYDATFQRIAPNVDVRVLHEMHPADFSGPLTLRCSYGADDYAVGTDESLCFKLPMLQTPFGDRTLYDLFGHTDTDEREYGIKLLATRLAEIDETIELPANWTVTNLPEDVALDGPSAALAFNATTSPGQLRYTCTLTIKKWTIPPGDFGNFKTVMDKFDELANLIIVCAPEVDDATR